MNKCKENKAISGFMPLSQVARFNPNNPLRIHIHSKSKSLKRSKKKMLKVKTTGYGSDWLG